MAEDQSNEERTDTNAGVKFEDSGWQAVQYYRESNDPKVIKWVMKYSGGLVKDEKQAAYVLIGLAVLAIVISLFLIMRTSGLISVKQDPLISPEVQLKNYKKVQPF